MSEAVSVLKKFPKILLVVSMDSSTEATYSKIRQGNWSKVVSGVDEFLEYGRTHDLDWEVGFSNLIMKSNIHEMSQMIDFALDRGARMGYGMIYGVKHKSENIFLYPELLDNIEWQHEIIKTEEKLNNLSEFWAEVALNNLKNIKRYLETEPHANLNMQDEEVSNLWKSKVCAFNGCKYHKKSVFDRRVNMLKTQGIGYMTKRAVGKVFGG